MKDWIDVTFVENVTVKKNKKRTEKNTLKNTTKEKVFKMRRRPCDCRVFTSSAVCGFHAHTLGSRVRTSVSVRVCVLSVFECV